MSTPQQRRPHQRASSETGSSLIIALAVMLGMGVIVAALGTYAQTNFRATASYREVREERYAGQAAISQLINWAKDEPEVGRDPALPIDHPDCVSHLPVEIAGEAETITASCEAEAGSGSGQPADTGLAPPEGIVLLGTRQNQPGPFLAPPCTGWLENIVDQIQNLVTYTNILSEDDGQDRIRETSFRLKPRTSAGVLNAVCQTRDRGDRSPFKVAGPIAAAGSMQSDGYQVQSIDPDGPTGPAESLLLARDTCGALFIDCRAGATADQAQYERRGYTGVQSYLNGSKRYQDPGRRWPKHPQDNPFGDIAAPWENIAFNQDGTVKPLGYTATAAMPSRLPERNRAFLRDPSTGALTQINPNTCSGPSATIVFLPGWYRNANLLNDFTANPACADATLWFAPDPGPDGLLLTPDDRTGAFYFDFRTGSAQDCNQLGARRNRWCIGGSRTGSAAAAQSPRIVVGTPDGWTPRSTPGNGALDPNTTFRVNINRANTIDLDLSQSWFNGGNAATINNQAARYQPTVCVIWCFAVDRAIRVRDFSPKVTGAPVGFPGAPRGRIYVRVRYGVQNATSANPARAIIEAVSPESGRKQCGTYTLISDRTQTEAGNNPANPTLHDYTFTDAQAAQLANTCGSVDLINGLEVKIEVRGNNFNTPTVRWYLDGVEMYYDSFDGARFPAPIGATNPAAQRDCDPSKAGGQFIFGGDSHMYVADGSIELCAGPYPVDPNNPNAVNVDEKQSIGVWAMPEVAEVRPIGAWAGPGTTTLRRSNNATITQEQNAALVADIDRQDLRMNFNACPLLGGFQCGGFPVTREAQLDVRMAGYTPPPGYVIERVTARFAYNARTDCAAWIQIACPRPAYRVGTCGKTEINRTQGTYQVVNPTVVVYDEATGRNCSGVASGGTSMPESYFYYFARCGWWCPSWTGRHELFDGVRYQITLRPASSTAPRLLPQSGCIVAWPNYAYGDANPDCALIKSDLARNNDDWAFPWEEEDGDSRGRISVKGTIYAPSSAVEVDDTDSAYPLATRGAVLRHLRISGFQLRQNYDAPAIDTRVDRTAAPRQVTVTACIQSAARRAAREECGGPDRILTQALVRFDIDTSDANNDGTPDVAPERRARVPQVLAWSDNR